MSAEGGPYPWVKGAPPVGFSTGGVAQAMAQYQPTPVSRNPSVSGAIEDLDKVIQRLAESAGNIDRIADTLQGPRPTVANNEAQQGSVTLVGNLFQRAETLSLIADRIQYALDAINKSL